MRTLNQRRNVPLKLKQRICASPCVVCGVPYFIRCDHIIPVALGGDCNEENLQSLCWGCNHAKAHRLTTHEVRLVVTGRGVRHFLEAVWREDTRYENAFDRRSLARWQREEPARVEHAVGLYLSFLGRGG